MGIRTAAIYSQADTEALHVKLADEAYLIGPPSALQSYLNIDKILDTAEQCEADAIHPGYGFLSEIQSLLKGLRIGASLSLVLPVSACIKPNLKTGRGS